MSVGEKRSSSETSRNRSEAKGSENGSEIGKQHMHSACPPGEPHHAIAEGDPLGRAGDGHRARASEADTGGQELDARPHQPRQGTSKGGGRARAGAGYGRIHGKTKGKGGGSTKGPHGQGTSKGNMKGQDATKDSMTGLHTGLAEAKNAADDFDIVAWALHALWDGDVVNCN